MTHPTDYLTDYVLGELAPSEVREVETHLATCESCRAEVRALRSGFVGLVERLPAVAPPPAAWQGVLARTKARSPRRAWLPSLGRPPLALAASVLIALGGLFWGFKTQQAYRQTQAEQRKVAGWLSRPDVGAQQLTDAGGERLGSVLTLADGRALFVLRDAPPPGSSYQAWGYGAYDSYDGAPVALGMTDRTLLEVAYSDYDALEISLEPRRGSAQPTQVLGRVEVPEEEHTYDN